MNVTTATEVRVTNVIYIDNKALNLVSLMRDEMGYGFVFRPTRVKVVALANGKVSVKGLGKGGFPALHVPGTTILSVEGDASMTLRKFIEMHG